MTAIRLGMRDFIPVGNGEQVGLRPLARDARPKARYADHVVELASSIHVGELRLHDERHPKLLIASEGETRRHHADDGHRLAAHLDLATDDRGITAEDSLPGRI